MINMARDFRLIPVVLVAAVCLLGLKVSGIVFDGGYTLGDRMRERAKPPGLTVTTADSIPQFPNIKTGDQVATADATSAKVPWAKEMFNYNNNESLRADVTGSVASSNSPSVIKNPAMNDVTGSAGGGEAKPAPAADTGPPLKPTNKPPAPTKLEVGGDAYQLAQQGKINSPGERAILGRLQDRRQELDDRGKQLEMQESLLKAAEKRIEAKVMELKDVESRQKQTNVVREKQEQDRFKSIVAMYENMKPKDAARIFERLDIRILVEVAMAMKPRTMSEILAAMSSEAAQRLTVELANHAAMQASSQQNPGELPKIEGAPKS
jgi:flagellar motility protein MotE (MotC chaperone)